MDFPIRQDQFPLSNWVFNTLFIYLHILFINKNKNKTHKFKNILF